MEPTTERLYLESGTQDSAPRHDVTDQRLRVLNGEGASVPERVSPNVRIHARWAWPKCPSGASPALPGSGPPPAVEARGLSRLSPITWHRKVNHQVEPGSWTGRHWRTYVRGVEIEWEWQQLGRFRGVTWGELVELRRHNLDLGDGFVRVAGSTSEVRGVLIEGRTTKSRAGVREVGVPAAIVPDLREHLRRWSERGPQGRVFVGPRGGRLLRSNYSRYWNEAVEKAGLGQLGLHFHDLRLTANSFVASSASLRELMTRMGHASPRAALIYQHASREREREITEALSQRIEAIRGDDLARKWHEADSGEDPEGA